MSRISKLGAILVLLCGLAAAQIPLPSAATVLTVNYNSISISNQQRIGVIFPPTFLPQVQVLILPNGPVPIAWLVTLTYTDAQGVTRTSSQVVASAPPFPNGTETTWTYFLADCYSKPMVTAQPLGVVGSTASNAAEYSEP
jgi:hypothetical protein